jgi:hypothetical protein
MKDAPQKLSTRQLGDEEGSVKTDAGGGPPPMLSAGGAPPMLSQRRPSSTPSLAAADEQSPTAASVPPASHPSGGGPPPMLSQRRSSAATAAESAPPTNPTLSMPSPGEPPSAPLVKPPAAPPRPPPLPASADAVAALGAEDEEEADGGGNTIDTSVSVCIQALQVGLLSEVDKIAQMPTPNPSPDRLVSLSGKCDAWAVFELETYASMGQAEPIVQALLHWLPSYAKDHPAPAGPCGWEQFVHRVQGFSNTDLLIKEKLECTIECVIAELLAVMTSYRCGEDLSAELSANLIDVAFKSILRRPHVSDLALYERLQVRLTDHAMHGPRALHSTIFYTLPASSFYAGRSRGLRSGGPSWGTSLLSTRSRSTPRSLST